MQDLTTKIPNMCGKVLGANNAVTHQLIPATLSSSKVSPTVLRLLATWLSNADPDGMQIDYRMNWMQMYYLASATGLGEACMPAGAGPLGNRALHLNRGPSRRPDAPTSPACPCDGLCACTCPPDVDDDDSGSGSVFEHTVAHILFAALVLLAAGLQAVLQQGAGGRPADLLTLH